MKKNLMMRLASFLLIAVLISTCTISGTYAKYVTSDSGSDTARVAKWGVEITPNGELFLQEYDTDDTTASVDDKSVKSEDTWDVVAPGTYGSLTEVALTGTPEVAVRVSYSAAIALDGWKLSDGTEYCPLIFNIEGKTYGTTDTAAEVTYASVAELKAGLEEVVAAYYKEYPVNTDLSGIGEADALSISWQWPFDVDPEHDAKDTDLGNLAAAGYHAVVQVEVTTTVTQID